MINRLSHSRLGNISFIALVTISYFVPRSLRSLVTKYDIVPRAIKLISPRLSYDNLYLYIYTYIASNLDNYHNYTCLYSYFRATTHVHSRILLKRFRRCFVVFFIHIHETLGQDYRPIRAVKAQHQW